MPAPCRLEGTTRSRSGVARPSGKVIPSIEPFLALRINGILLVDAGYQQIVTSPCRDARDLVAVAPRELGVHARTEIPGARYLRMSRDFPSAPSSMCAAHAGALHSLLHLPTTSTTLPPITTLLLHRVGAPDPEDFLQCLELLPSLAALHIARAPDDGVPWRVLVRLACTNFRAPLVPRLTALSLRYARGRVPEKLRRALRVMLRSRAGRKVLRGVEVEALQSVETDLDADAASEEDTRGDGV